MIIHRPDLIELFHILQNKYGMERKEFNLFGVRCPVQADKDLYKDYLGIETGTTLMLWPGTTDPGIQATEQKEGGAAHLALGLQKNIWRVGIHASGTGFAHQALVQTGTGSVKIWRDENRDYQQQAGEKTEDGWFGINFHRSALTPEEHIGPYSWGCQVTQDIKDFNVVINIILKSESYQKNNQMDISYLLLTLDEFPIFKAGGIL